MCRVYHVALPGSLGSAPLVPPASPVSFHEANIAEFARSEFAKEQIAEALRKVQMFARAKLTEAKFANVELAEAKSANAKFAKVESANTKFDKVELILKLLS